MKGLHDNGGPAFPQMVSRIAFDDDEGIKRTMIDSTGGMTLRDWFAGQAMGSLIRMYAQGDPSKWYEFVAKHARGFADAMVKAGPE